MEAETQDAMEEFLPQGKLRLSDPSGASHSEILWFHKTQHVDPKLSFAPSLPHSSHTLTCILFHKYLNVT